MKSSLIVFQTVSKIIWHNQYFVTLAQIFIVTWTLSGFLLFLLKIVYYHNKHFLYLRFCLKIQIITFFLFQNANKYLFSVSKCKLLPFFCFKIQIITFFLFQNTKKFPFFCFKIQIITFSVSKYKLLPFFCLKIQII